MELKKLALTNIVAHPQNPRIILNQSVIDDITAGIIADGGEYRQCYAILVRPMPDGTFQCVSGHHRTPAARKAKLEQIWAWVEDMTEEEAYLRLCSANNQSPLTPLEIGLHSLNYTGSAKEYAARVGKSSSSISELKGAAKAYQNIIRMSETETLDDLRLRLIHKGNHLVQIAKAPENLHLWLAQQMLDENWPVLTCKKAQEVVKHIGEIPDQYHSWLKPEETYKEAIADAVSGQNRFHKSVKLWINTADEEAAALDESRQTWVFIDDGTTPSLMTMNPRRMFYDAVSQLTTPSKTRIQATAQSVLEILADYDKTYAEWEESRKQDLDEQAAREQAAKERLARQVTYAPKGIHSPMEQAAIPKATFDIVLTDPSYLLSNGGITVRSGKEVSVDKNFEDTKGTALEPEQWLPIVCAALKPGGVLIFTATAHMDVSKSLIEDFSAIKTKSGDVENLVFHEELIWNPPSNPPRLTPTGHVCTFEQIWVAYKTGGKPNFNYESIRDDYWGGKQPLNVLQFGRCSGKERLGFCDTQKPLDLWEYLLKAYAPPNASVLDPFSGSGTTAIACKNLGHHCLWIEQDDQMYKKALQRIEQHPFPWEKTSKKGRKNDKKKVA